MEKNIMKSIGKKAREILKEYGNEPMNAEQLIKVVSEKMTDDEIKYMATNDFIKLCRFMTYMKHKKQQDKKQFKNDLAFQ